MLPQVTVIREMISYIHHKKQDTFLCNFVHGACMSAQALLQVTV
jgi:hypothetical protein